MHKKEEGNEKSTHKLTNRKSARQKDKGFYQSTLIKSIRTVIARSLRSPPHHKTFSIIADPAFTEEIIKSTRAFVTDRKTSNIAGVGPGKPISNV